MADNYHFTYLFLPSCLFSGASSLLDIGSKPTLEELDELIVGCCSGWEQAALSLGVQSYVLDALKWDNPNNAEEACRGVLRRWLLHAPGTGETERTWHSVLEALETSGHSQLAGQLKREHFVDSSEGPISPLSQTVTSAGKSWDSTTLTASYSQLSLGHHLDALKVVWQSKWKLHGTRIPHILMIP